ncbi:MAG: hypothetical protein GEU76_13550 [Alphaproteobacteria bacterium]|nr:hypothetical protein [Alphaproteobacteria bacterium]
MTSDFLPGVPADRVRAAYAAAPGNEFDSGKFASKESSAALAANAFGYFLERASDLPPLPGTEASGWPARSVMIESTLRFPWRGGHHPWLDAVVVTDTALIGVESKRYEPFRPKSSGPYFSEAYWRDVWGNAMNGYQAVRDSVADGTRAFQHLDAPQLVKHALGLRSSVHRKGVFHGKNPVLHYVYAEPQSWPEGRRIPAEALQRHRDEIGQFAEAVSGCEVVFASCSYRELAASWTSGAPHVHAHAAALLERFTP